MSRDCSVLVTGDIVEDIHVYIDSDHGPTQRATVLAKRLGGAALTRDLIVAAGVGGAMLGLMPVEPEVARVGAVAEAPALPSYGVWTPHPRAPQTSERVWRVATNGGYGAGDGELAGWKPNPAAAADGLIVVDDGALAFRHSSARQLWPQWQSARHVLLKHSAPIVRGELWAELLQQAADRLVVLVSADDLRREDALISRRLSWEQTAIDTLRAMATHPLLRELARAAHLVVGFRAAGALWLPRGGAARLMLRPAEMEGEHTRPGLGSVYGFQSCMTAAIACRLAGLPAGNDAAALESALLAGIESGLAAQRQLYDLGHGPADSATPGFPVEAIGQTLAAAARGFVRVSLPPELAQDASFAAAWSILDAQEPAPPGTAAPMAGLAKLVARYGRRALDDVPSLAVDPLFTVDRGEIESLRALQRGIEDYEAVKVQGKPLSIAVFGPPGAGKSFAVKAIARKALPGSTVLEFNLSQFDGPSDFVGALHQVRDAVLGGRTPVVFWDEFDCAEYKWLQYLLAPMQDGTFQEDRITHPIGKCVFVFAGGTSATLEGFGPPPLPAGDAAASMDVEALRSLQAQHQRFRLLKGPDFVSRLHGYLNILGPNPRRPGAPGAASDDRTYPIRRALILRALLGAREGEVLALDAGLLHALLTVAEFRHGARSFEKIVLALRTPGSAQLSRSALPALPVLDRDVDAQALLRLMNERDAFKTTIDIERLAAAVHENYRVQAHRRGWPIEPRIDREYTLLDADARAANRSAALRMPELLELIDQRIEPTKRGEPAEAWQGALRQAIERHLDRLAKAEHLAWMEERLAAGWRAGAPRDDAKRVHPSLVDWNQLTQSDHEKDQANIRVMPEVLVLAGFRAIAG